MQTIETATGIAIIVNERVAMFRARAGIEINYNNSVSSNQQVAEQMPGDYGIIIDRVADYSIAPVEVFQVLNNLPRLKALAIVVHRESSARTAEIDKRLFKGAIEVFSSVDEAQQWVESILDALAAGQSG